MPCALPDRFGVRGSSWEGEELSSVGEHVAESSLDLGSRHGTASSLCDVGDSFIVSSTIKSKTK